MIIDILKHALELAREGVEIHNENSPEYKVCAALIATLEAKDDPDYKALWQQMCERCDELDKKLAQRKPLTDEEIEKMRHLIDWTAHWSYNTFARAIEAAHGITGENNG